MTDVGDGTLLARRARQRGELGEEVDDLGGHRAILVARYAEAAPTADAFARALERGADEVAEERRRSRRPRLELRMELARDEPGMIGQLDDLDEPSLLERPRDDEPGRRRARAGSGC